MTYSADPYEDAAEESRLMREKLEREDEMQDYWDAIRKGEIEDPNNMPEDEQ